MTLDPWDEDKQWLVNINFEHMNIYIYISHMPHGAGIFTYIHPKNDPNVGTYSIHGAYG